MTHVLEILQFKSGKKEYSSRRDQTAFFVQNPSDTRNFQHITGHEIIVDGIVVHCVGVLFADHPAPWRKGEPIGILAKGRL